MAVMCLLAYLQQCCAWTQQGTFCIQLLPMLQMTSACRRADSSCTFPESCNICSYYRMPEDWIGMAAGMQETVC